MIAIYVVAGFVVFALILFLTPSKPLVASVESDEEILKISQTNKIGAIKEYRALHGVGLKDAKDAVEAMMNKNYESHNQASKDPIDTGAKLDEIKTLLNGGNKIAAIKEYRALYGVGLKDAKEAVEAMS